MRPRPRSTCRSSTRRAARSRAASGGRRSRTRRLSPRSPASRSPSSSSASSSPAPSRSAAPSSRCRASGGRAAPRRRHLLRREPRQGHGLRRARARHSGRDPRAPQRRRGQVPGHRWRSARSSCARLDGSSTRPRSSRSVEAAASGRVYLTAFDDDVILAANGGTLAAEVLEDAPDARTFLLPVGGAGLAGGFAFYAKSVLPEARIIGCQHALSPALALSLERGEAVVRLPPVATTAGRRRGRHRPDRLRGAEGPDRRRRAADRGADLRRRPVHARPPPDPDRALVGGHGRRDSRAQDRAPRRPRRRRRLGPQRRSLHDPEDPRADASRRPGGDPPLDRLPASRSPRCATPWSRSPAASATRRCPCTSISLPPAAARSTSSRATGRAAPLRAEDRGLLREAALRVDRPGLRRDRRDGRVLRRRRIPDRPAHGRGIGDGRARARARPIGVLGILGTGVQARLQAELHRAVLPLAEIHVWGRNPERAAACARDIGVRLPGVRVGRVALARRGRRGGEA